MQPYNKKSPYYALCAAYRSAEVFLLLTVSVARRALGLTLWFANLAHSQHAHMQHSRCILHCLLRPPRIFLMFTIAQRLASRCGSCTLGVAPLRASPGHCWATRSHGRACGHASHQAHRRSTGPWLSAAGRPTGSSGELCDGCVTIVVHCLSCIVLLGLESISPQYPALAEHCWQTDWKQWL
jgi:hypothetical protein